MRTWWDCVKEDIKVLACPDRMLGQKPGKWTLKGVCKCELEQCTTCTHE